MEQEKLLELLAEVQRHQGELDNLGSRSVQGGTPKRLFERTKI